MTDEEEEDLANEPSNADVKFHYVVNPDGHVHWFPTAAKAHAWVETHKREHGTYCLAYSAETAQKIVAGTYAPPTSIQRKRKPRSDKGVKRTQLRRAS